MSTCIHRNHPVHIIDGKRKMTSSSFIPFCEIGGNMSIMGTKVDQFDVPVCNSFQARILNDQLCYEVDPNQFITSRQNLENVFETGLTFLVDYNEDRQVILDDTYNKVANKNLVEQFEKAFDNQKMLIYLNTIGMYQNYFRIGRIKTEY